MRRFYYHLADKLKNYTWGRSLVNHISYHQRFYENFEALYTALILALLIKTFIFEAYKIPSSSMEDTLQPKDRIFVSKLVYNYRDIHVGDIVVFKTKGIPDIEDPLKPYYIKRVVGLPGDSLQILPNRKILRNGILLDDPEIFLENEYYSMGGRTQFIVPEGEVYVFGDNSGNSLDSRAWGGVPLENVMGKAFFRYWPPSRIGTIQGIPPASVLQNQFEQDASLARKRTRMQEAHAADQQ